MDDTIFVSSKEIWTRKNLEINLYVMLINVGKVVEFSGADLNRFLIEPKI